MNYSPKKNILIVDDDKDALVFLEDLLISTGFNVKSFPCAPDIFGIIRDYRPDLVLMDYILTGINGGELCHQIKSNPVTSELPVILISAYPKVIESLGLYGCNAFIEKPFNIWDLISSINQCLYATA